MGFFIFVIAFLVFIILVVITFTSLYKGAPFVVTDQRTLERIVDMSGSVSGKDVVDLGSGDGRILFRFAEKGARATGFEINPFLVAVSRIKIRRLRLENEVRVFWRNFWAAKLSDYDLVVVYGIGHIMKPLEKKLKAELKPGAKVISHSYKFPNWKPVKQSKNVSLYIRG